MGVVSTQTSGLPRGRALTVADLEQLPDDGHRYELIDGALIVTSAPIPRHQIVVTALWRLLDDHQPTDKTLRVLVAPLDVVLSDDTAVEPDVFVARRSDFGEKNLPAAPLLAVEVLSPSTRLIDLNVKHDRYRRAGVPSYWVVDPDEPRLTAWELAVDRYVQVADVTGDQSWSASRPYPLAVVPSDLID